MPTAGATPCWCRAASFDLAHELFHILTWDAMPPEHFEEAMEIVEQLEQRGGGSGLQASRGLVTGWRMVMISGG